jgi:uncharacterized protein
MTSQDEKDLSNIIKVLSKYPNISQFILFGSRAKEIHRKASDWDLAIKGSNITLAEIAFWLTEIEDLWLPNEVDLISYESIVNTALKEHIDNFGRVVWKKEVH